MAEAHPTYVVGDVHGHRDELVASLADAGLVSAAGAWTGDAANLWFLGDFVDRGPDGIGVIDLVMRLAEEAAAAGGRVDTVLGNHEILLLGMRRFGDTEVPSDSSYPPTIPHNKLGLRSFARSWDLNGGRESDQEALTDEHIAWLTGRPALAVVEDHLLMHSDTDEYLGWGGDVSSINSAVAAVLSSDDLTEWWEVWRRMTTRHAFRGPQGEETVDKLLAVLGGSRIVHGHSVIADQLGIMPTEVSAPLSYANGKALGIDAGIFIGGPCLVVPLPWNPED